MREEIAKTGLLQLYAFAIGILTNIWVARSLGVVGYGELTFALSLAQLFAMPFASAFNIFFVSSTVSEHMRIEEQRDALAV